MPAPPRAEAERDQRDRQDRAPRRRARVAAPAAAFSTVGTVVARASVGRDWDAWRVKLWARNVLDEEYAVRGFYFGNEPPDFPPTLYTRFGDPRHYGITVSYGW